MRSQPGRQIPKSYRPQRQRVPLGARAFVLQPRDVEMIGAVFENRFLTRELLAHLFPPTAETWGEKTANPIVGAYLNRRLAKLFHAGYLDRLRTVRGGELIYAVSNLGLGLLRENQPALPLPGRADNRRLSNQYIHHALMIARVRSSLTVALRSLPHFTLEKFERESMELKATWRSQGAAVYVNPDAFFILRDTTQPEGRQRTAFFVECDRGTMPIQRASKGTSYVAKFQRYTEMHERGEQKQFDVRAFRMLTIIQTERDSAVRAGRILKYAALDPSIKEDHRKLFLFATEDAYREHPANILGRIWKRADDPREKTAIVHPPLPVQ